MKKKYYHNIMKKFYLILIVFLTLPMVTYATIGSNSSLPNIEVYLFTNKCDQCNKEETWLKEIYTKYSTLNYSVINVSENQDKYKEVIKQLNISNNKFPLFIIGTNYFTGFNDKTKIDIEEAIKAYSTRGNYCNILNTKLSIEECQKINEDIYKNNHKSINLVIPLTIVLIIILSCLAFKIFRKSKNN